MNPDQGPEQYVPGIKFRSLAFLQFTLTSWPAANFSLHEA
jgi:hypothetical protein